jgi:3-mercaptopyruvate sulfurtransferase SseA
VSEIALEELARRLADVSVIDVRTPAEYDGSVGHHCDPRQGHIPGARNVSVEDLLHLDEPQIRELVRLPAEAEIVVYCHGGSRSRVAAEVLRSLGYNARNYVGSWHEWSRTDLPLET